jgi:hypothetical protein
MSGKRIIGLFLFVSLLIFQMGCGKKAPPTLPEKSSFLPSAAKTPRHEGKIEKSLEKHLVAATSYYN